MVGSMVLIFGTVVPGLLARVLEFVVGIMLILLGTDVICRIVRNRVHFHVHSHGALTHIHAHSHTGESDHSGSRHAYNHPKRLTLRALLIGVVHGIAGSGALVILALGTVKSIWTGILYMVLFGPGRLQEWSPSPLGLPFRFVGQPAV